ncbi:MAG: hypothetical protein RBQ91_00390 [Acholeplasma sp.]|nr:hypothetical protein [Acholeplasma sp.]
MKKILSTIILTTTFLMILALPVKASTEDFSTVDKESISLIDKNLVSFNNVEFNLSNYNSVGYVVLKMGYSTTYTVNLSNILSYLNDYEASNISKTYLEFDLQAVYTGTPEENHRWYSSNTDWDYETKRLDLKGNVPTSSSIEVWWNNGSSGGAPSTTTGGLRIYSIRFVVEYTEPVELYTTITNLNQLPFGNNLLNSYDISNNLAEVLENEVTTVPIIEVNNDYSWNFYFDFDDDQRFKAMNVVMPESIETTEFKHIRYFATSDYQFLLMFYNLNSQNVYDSDYVIWNITTSEFQQVVSDVIYGKPFVTGNGYSTYNMIYVDVSIPYEMDDVTSIDFSYKYRYHYPLPFPYYGSTQNGYKTLVKGVTTEHTFAWWVRFNMVHLSAIAIDHIGNFGWFEEDQIKEVTSSYTAEKKTDFLSYLNSKSDINYTMSDVFPTNSKVYRVFLGQHDKLGSNAVDIIEPVALNLRYVNDSVEHFVPNPEQVIPTPDPSHPGDPIIEENENQFLKGLGEIWSTWYTIISIGLSIVLGVYTFKIITFAISKKVKHRALIQLGLISLYIMLFLFLR